MRQRTDVHFGSARLGSEFAELGSRSNGEFYAVSMKTVWLMTTHETRHLPVGPEVAV